LMADERKMIHDEDLRELVGWKLKYKE
jgi:hypothetical protein